jgi:DedD protein
MASSQDTEITLGTGKLLALFFGLVGICAVFFALGYSLGRKSEPAVALASAPGIPQPSSNTNKASSGSATPASAPAMTFYKNVEQKEASPELTPAADAKTDTSTANPAAANGGTAAAAQNNGVDPATALPLSGYFVQVAAVSKQEDADSLVDALKKKDYPAFVAAAASADKLFHVQLGPYSDIKDAEGMRTKLIGDGYSPILKK